MSKVAPKHYMLGDGLQAIDVIFKLLAMKDCDPFIAYCWGNVLKYMMRWTEHDGATDLRKAHRYLTWILEYQDTGKITHEADDCEKIRDETGTSSAATQEAVEKYDFWQDIHDATIGNSRARRIRTSS